jgi:PhzF family phenazine biosynthesis protein
MPLSRPFKQVDVFTDLAYRGNPLAVVLDGSGLSDADMQRFANWTNLSETTFLLPPSPEGRAGGADYRVRIFTPRGELPFAGHPTLGSCHAWLEAGGVPGLADTLVQECAVGLVKIQRDSQRLSFAAPALKRSPANAELHTDVCTALGLPPEQVLRSQLLNNGPTWLGLLIDSPETLLALTPDHHALQRLGTKVGLIALHDAPQVPSLIGRSNREARAFSQNQAGIQSLPTSGELPKVEVRAFAAPVGVNEDPVTGSLNASLAQWLITEGILPDRYIATQGTCLGREGQVFVQRDIDGQVWVGGHNVTCVDGRVTL